MLLKVMDLKDHIMLSIILFIVKCFLIMLNVYLGARLVALKKSKKTEKLFAKLIAFLKLPDKFWEPPIKKISTPENLKL